MVCPCCGAELRDGVRYCTTCGVAVHGLSTAPALWIQSRKHVVVVLACMLTIALAGGSWLGLQLYQTMSCFISAHSEHAIVLNISAAGWDTDNGASRVPIHITGKTVDGTTVDEIDYVASDGSGISLIQGVYTLDAAGPPSPPTARSIKFRARAPRSPSTTSSPQAKRSIWPSSPSKTRYSPSAPSTPPI